MNKGLLGKAKIPIAILSIILVAIFVISFVLPSIAEGSSATKDIYFLVKDSYSNPVQNAKIEMFVANGLDGDYLSEISVITGNDGRATISTSSLDKYAYFVVSKVGYDSDWPDETNGVYSETADDNIILVDSIDTSVPIQIMLDIIPSIWTGKSNYNPEESVDIYGIGFEPDKYPIVKVKVVDPNGGESITEVTVNDNGEIYSQYKLDGIQSEYSIFALDSSDSVLTSTTFMDSGDPTVIFNTTNGNPMHDTYVRWQSTGTQYQNTNYNGDNIHVKWRNDGSGIDRRRSYLKFNISSIPSGANITAATLHLYQFDADATDNINVSRVSNNYTGNSTPWTETGLTWNNTPTDWSTGIATSVGSSDGYKTLNVSIADVNASLYGNKVLSLVVKFSNETTPRHHDFCDKEDSTQHCDSNDRPYLEITYTLPPQQVCGNGILEGNEECEKVGGIWPACCNNSTCMFKSSSNMCRASAGQCDVAENCSGSNADCPGDAKAPFSTPCDDGLWCSETDHCDGKGSCVQLTARVCNNPPQPQQCYNATGTCNEQTDTCDYTKLPDNTGPITSNVLVNPSYNNGIFNVTATATDQCSNIKTSEYFLRHSGSVNCGTPGTGTLMPAEDGNFDELIEDLRKDSIEYFMDGSNRICIQSQDVANNWGNCECGYFETDTKPPELVYNFTLNHVPNPHELLVCGNNPLINVTICDSQSDVQGGEYFLDKWIPPMPVPAPWSGYWLNILNHYLNGGWHCSDLSAIVNLTPLSEGTHYINQIRGKDIVENWGKIYGQNFSYSFVKDTTPPSTTKDVDTPKVRCAITDDGDKNSVEECWYIQQGTHIHLSAVDPDPQQTGEFSGLDKIMCQFRWKNNTEDAWSAWSDPAECPNPIVFNKDSYHEIKYWAVDKCGNPENPHYEIDIVDTQAPKIWKEVGIPSKLVNSSCNPQQEVCSYYMTQQTSITFKCVDQEPHPVDDVTMHIEVYWKENEGDQWQFEHNFTQNQGEWTFTCHEDSIHKLVYWCEDALGNVISPKEEVDYVDTQAPVSNKTVGQPRVECSPNVKGLYGDPKDGCWYITNHTPITLNCTDTGQHPVNNVSIYYRDYFYNTQPPVWTRVNANNITIFKEDSAHVLEWYCVDELLNEEQHHYEIDIVDTQAPHTNKTIIGKQYPGSGDVHMWIRQDTTIKLNCTDLGPHPVNDVTLYYRDYLDGTIPSAFTPVQGGYVEIKKKEDCKHRLEWYCVDALGNSEGSAENPIVEIDQVDTAPPEIVKWVDDNTVQPGDTVRICANVTDKKLTGDPGVGVDWVKAHLYHGDDPNGIDLINVGGNTYCGNWTAPPIKECWWCHGLHCEYRCVWELWVEAEDLLDNHNETDGIEIIVDNADPKIEAVLWPSKDKYYRDGKKFEVKALAIDFGGDENILNSDNCKASGVKECRFYAIKYNFESVDQSEIKNLWDYLHWLEETTGTPIKTVYLGSVPWENGYCKGSLQFPEDSGLSHEDIL
jgi:hypothetical protein